MKGKRIAVKDGRTIQMGWTHFEHPDEIQVRSEKGGGTDDILAPKNGLRQL